MRDEKPGAAERSFVSGVQDRVRSTSECLRGEETTKQLRALSSGMIVFPRETVRGSNQTRISSVSMKFLADRIICLFDKDVIGHTCFGPDMHGG